ncbi:unnamed protein product [Wickerhamomyces anomalus]
MEQIENQSVKPEQVPEQSPNPVAENSTQLEEPMDIAEEPITEQAQAQDDVQIRAPSSILIVGATGLVGLRFIKYVQRIATEEQTIYVLTRRRLFRERPGVIVKITEVENWPAEIALIPNLTTVYSALSFRSNNMYIDSQSAGTNDEFYLVHNNMNYQIAIAAKEAGVSTFIFTSHFSVSYPIPRLLMRRTKMRNAIEKNLEALDFDRLIILRPGPLFGVREKTGTLKGFSFTSVLSSMNKVLNEPLYLIDPVAPLNTMNFATSVAKTAAIRANGEATGKVEIYNQWMIMMGAMDYNMFNANRLLGLAMEAFEKYDQDGVLIHSDEFHYEMNIDINSH